MGCRNIICQLLYIYTYISLYCTFHFTFSIGVEIGKLFRLHIRASVDALCRDGTSEISRDPRTKRLQTRRESLARPSKYTNNNLLDSYLAVHKPSSFLPASSLPRENPLTRDFHNFRVIIFIIILIIIIIIIISKPAISLLEPGEALIFSPNISSVDGGVHGREAIVLGSLCITTVDHGAPRR